MPMRVVLGAAPGTYPASLMETWVFDVGAKKTCSIDVDMPLFVIYNSDTAAHTLTAQPRAA